MTETGYNDKVVKDVTDSFMKHILKALAHDYDHKVILQNFVVMEVKPYAKSNKKSPKGDPISPYSRRLIVNFTSNLKRKISANGLEQAIKDIWEDK